FLDLGLLVFGEEFAAFDIHQGRSHHEEFPRDVEVQFAHDLDVFDELSRDFGEVDFVNIDLLLLYEVKKQVEGALEDLKLDFIRFHQHAAPFGQSIEKRM